MPTKRAGKKATGTSTAELRRAIKASGLPPEQIEAIDTILAKHEPKPIGRPKGSFDFGMWSLMQEEPRASGAAHFVWDENDRVANRPAYATKDVPGAALLCGDFSHCVIGLFGAGLRIDANPAQNFNSGGGAARVVLEADVCVTQPAALVSVAAVT